MFKQSLSEGLLTYGYVVKSEKINLTITLPEGFTGIVKATSISPAYTAYLKSFVNNGNKKLSKMDGQTLPDLFPEGSFLVCKIISTKEGIYNLSVSPVDLNSNIGERQIKNKMIIVGSVQSVEDHGYLIDIGLKDVYAFLSNKNASNYNDRKLKVGQQLHCLIVSIKKMQKNVIRTVALTADPFKVATQMIKDSPKIPITSICPGLQAEATIIKDEGSHFEAKFLSYDAVIPKYYCKQELKLNSVVRATVLQHHPETNIITLHLKMTPGCVESELFPGISIGDIIDGVVKHINVNNELYLQLSNGFWGFAYSPYVTEHKRPSVKEKYFIDSNHRCCVMRFLPLENLIEVKLNWKPKSFENLQEKDIVSGDVLKTKTAEIQKKEKKKKADKIKLEMEKTKTAEIRKKEKKRNADEIKLEREKTKTAEIRKKEKKRNADEIKLEREKTKSPEMREKGKKIRNADIAKIEMEEAEKSNNVIKKKLAKTPKTKKLIEIGTISHGIILKKLDKNFKICLMPSGVTALLPKIHLSDFEELSEIFWSIFHVGDTLDVVNFKHLEKLNICSRKRSQILAAESEKFLHTFSDIHVGQILSGIVKTVVDYGIFVEFPGGLRSLAVTKDITTELDTNLHKYFKKGMTVSTQVCQVSKKKHQFRVSLKPKKTNIDPSFCLNYFQLYFEEKRIITELLRSKKDFLWMFGDLQVGDLCCVTVTKVFEAGINCDLKSGTKGFIAINHTKGLTIKEDQQIEGVILNIGHLYGIVQLVASTTVVKRVKKTKKNSVEIPKNTNIRAVVMLVQREFIVVLLRVKRKSRLAYLSPKMHINDAIGWHRYNVDDKITVRFVEYIGCNCIVKLHTSTKKALRLTEKSQKIMHNVKTPRISHAHDNTINQKYEAMEVDTATNAKPRDQSQLKKKTSLKRKSENNVDSNDISSGNELRKGLVKKKRKLEQKSIEVMPPVYFNWNNVTAPVEENGYVSSEEDIEMEGPNDEGTTTSTLLKKKKAARKLEKKREEEKLYEIERQRIGGEKAPETADDFDRLLLNSPNSSMLWLRYMAFHLETAEVDKARSVAERALKTILFREEQEKFNVWIAYLNLENLYGSKENLTSVLQRALQQNQPLKVYQQLVNVYTKSGKIEAARDVYDILLKRFRNEKEVWIHFAIFCYKNGFLEQGRELIEKAVRTIDKKDHVALVSKIAQLEFKFGDVERGTTMFENIVSNYPRRTDLWSIYIDMAMLQNQKEQIRHLFQRVTNLKLSSRKMKFFYKRYLNFEEKNGDKESAESVREKAKQYVDESV